MYFMVLSFSFNFSKGLILNCFACVGLWKRADSMEPIQGLLQALMETVDYPASWEMLEDTIALIEINRRQPRIVP